MATNEPGQSSGNKETEEKTIHYNLIDLDINLIKQGATCKLEMPSNLSSIWLRRASYNHPIVILDLKHPRHDIHCITLMRDCLHKNILHARLVMQKDPYLLVWTEYVTGVLSTYFTSEDPFKPDNGGIEVACMIPSSKLQDIATQMLAGLNALWLQDKYHGNLTLENTFYHETDKGDIVVKLSGFERKGEAYSVLHYQAKDLESVGTVLERISQIAKELNKQGFKLDCYQIDYLVKRLKVVAMGDMKWAMADIKKEPFFWTAADRKYFFVSIVPLAMQHKFIREKVDGEEKLCTLPWDKDDYDGFLTLMVNYRILKKKPPYKYTSRVSYVYFISGIYVHEVELKHPSAVVDTTVMRFNRRLFQLLSSLLPRDPRQLTQ